LRAGIDGVKNASECARAAQAGGAAAVTVHGRLREQMYQPGTVDRTVIAAVKRAVSIPVYANGDIVTPNRLIAKVSRVEVASKFFAPPPAKFLTQLVEQGHLTQDQAKLAEQIPVAQDLTAEADSGGHTDNRPAVTLIPTMLALRDRMMAQHKFTQPLRVGAAGGISTPASGAAGVAMTMSSTTETSSFGPQFTGASFRIAARRPSGVSCSGLAGGSWSSCSSLARISGRRPERSMVMEQSSGLFLWQANDTAGRAGFCGRRTNFAELIEGAVQKNRKMKPHYEVILKFAAFCVWQ